MRKLHLPDKIVDYRIHGRVVEFRDGNTKTIVSHDDMRQALGMPKPYCNTCDDGFDCGDPEFRMGAAITPSMCKDYLLQLDKKQN